MTDLPSSTPAPSESAAATSSLRTQLIRFILVGGFAAVIDIGLTEILQFGFDVDKFWSKSAGWLAGTLTAYVINRRWTFRAKGSARLFAMVMGLYLITYTVQLWIYTGLLEWWGETPALAFAAFVIAQGVATAINFVGQRRVIFRATSA